MQWTLEIGNIAVIGAYTTPNGPYLDDYFVVFVARDGTIYDISMDTSGVTETLDVLAHKLKTTLRPGLANSTEWKTQILWPESLRLEPLFEIKEIAETSLLGQLRRRLFGARGITVLAPSVKDFIAQQSA